MVSNGEAADPAAGQAVTPALAAHRRAQQECDRIADRSPYRQGFVAGAEWARAEAQRELAARVLPVLERVEWVAFADIVSMCGGCYPGSGAYGHKDGCPVAALIAELRALSEETGGGTDAGSGGNPGSEGSERA